MKPNKESIAHIIIISIIVIILAVAAFKLIRWNISSKEELKGVETDEDFDTESEDYIALVNPKHLEGREDDGVTTIVMLGDDTLSKYPGDDGIAKQTQALSNAVVYDCSFSNSYITCESSALTGYDAFSLFAAINAIAAGDFSHMKTTLENGTIKERSYQNTISTLQDIDFDKVDVLTIYYGPNDYLLGREITKSENMNDITTYTGALKSSIETLQSVYPHIRIITLSPNYFMMEEDGKPVGCDLVDTGYGTLPAYMIGAKNIAVMTNTTYLDNYFGLPINESTYKDYVQDDFYPNKEARKLVAERIADVLVPSEVQAN